MAKHLYLDTWAIRQLLKRRSEPRLQALLAKLKAGDEWRLVVSSLTIFELVRGVQNSADERSAEEAAELLDECNPLITATVPSRLRDAEVADEVLALLGVSSARTAGLKIRETFQEAASTDPDAAYLVGPGTYRTLLETVRGYLKHPGTLAVVLELQTKWLEDATAITPALLANGVRGSRAWLEVAFKPGYLARKELLPPIVRRILTRHLPTTSPAGIGLDPRVVERELDRASLGRIPTVAIELLFLARRAGDSAKLEESFVMDVMHASLALPYTDAVVLERQAAEYLREHPFSFPTAIVLRGLDEAAALVLDGAGMA